METIFHSAEDIVDNVQLYHEGESIDVTARVREAGERFQNETFRRLGIRRPAPGVFANGYLPGETEPEHRRRINLWNGREPEDDGRK